jgi:hypothetical protein
MRFCCVRYVPRQRYESTGGIKQTRTQNRSGNGRGARAALRARPTYSHSHTQSFCHMQRVGYVPETSDERKSWPEFCGSNRTGDCLSPLHRHRQSE